jgi:hypothetical protein
MVENRTTPTEIELEALAAAWDYVLDDIPSQYLVELSRRAIKAKRDTYPLSAIDMRREWDGLHAELEAQERQAKEARLLDMARKGVCTECMGAGWVRMPYRADMQWPAKLVKCGYCEGPAPNEDRPRISPPTFFTDWREHHKGKYPDGCDKMHCIVCYMPMHRVSELVASFGWLHGAAVPTKEEDRLLRGSIRNKA